MFCPHCGNEPPDQSRYCNLCGQSLQSTKVKREKSVPLEYRHLYIDLYDLQLPSEFRSAEEKAMAVSHIYERFTPFADDGWEWCVHPGDTAFLGWVHQKSHVIGANLLCKRTVPHAVYAFIDPQHHISEYRLHQLAQGPRRKL